MEKEEDCGNNRKEDGAKRSEEKRTKPKEGNEGCVGPVLLSFLISPTHHLFLIKV
jgi:hypothetical protein